MKLIVTSFFGVMATAGVAAACPAMDMSSGSEILGQSALASGQTYDLTAGGANTLEQCGLGMLGFAQFRSMPDVTFVPQADGGAIALSVASDCDPALLVNTADGGWHFNDDADGLNPALTLSDPAALAGQVDVWVGTFVGDECPAVLTV